MAWEQPIFHSWHMSSLGPWRRALCLSQWLRSQPGKCWWQWGGAWRFARGFFTITAHISSVRTSPTVPPKNKGFGKCEGAVECLVRSLIKAWWLQQESTFPYGLGKASSRDQVQLGRDKGPDSGCLRKRSSSASISKQHFLKKLIIRISVPNQLFFFDLGGDLLLNKKSQEGFALVLFATPGWCGKLL